MKCNLVNRLIVPLAAVAGMLIAVNVDAAVIAGPIINPANGHAYTLLDAADWNASEAEAVALGGHLVTINDPTENSWVFDTFVPLLPAGPNAIWLGLNDALNEGSFVWASGESASYTNWSAGQPDNARGVEDYAHIWTPQSVPQAPEVWQQWNDLSADWPGLYGLVESIPEPSSFSLLAIGLFSVLGLCGRMKHRQ